MRKWNCSSTQALTSVCFKASFQNWESRKHFWNSLCPAFEGNINLLKLLVKSPWPSPQRVSRAAHHREPRAGAALPGTEQEMGRELAGQWPLTPAYNESCRTSQGRREGILCSFAVTHLHQSNQDGPGWLRGWMRYKCQAVCIPFWYPANC